MEKVIKDIAFTPLKMREFLTQNLAYLFPVLFITIACGAIFEDRAFNVPFACPTSPLNIVERK